MYPIGTIICIQFGKKKYEGEITQFDPNNTFYKVKYHDCDTEDITADEIKTHCKLIQSYNHGQPLKPLQFLFIIPTPKTTPQPATSPPSIPTPLSIHPCLSIHPNHTIY